MAAQNQINTEALELSGYGKSLGARLDYLNESVEKLSSTIDATSSSVDLKKQSLKKELEELKDDAHEIKEEVRKTQKLILAFINRLKASAKQEELERFKKRIDTWAPESFVNKKEAERVIRERLG